MKRIVSLLLIGSMVSPSAFARAPRPPQKPAPVDIETQSKNAIDSLQLSSSPFEVCQDVPLITNKDYLKNKDFWDQARMECEALDIQILPDTGFINTLIGKLGEQDDAVRSLEFLNRVGKRTAQYMQTNNEITEHLIHCAKKDKAWFDTQLAKAKTAEEREFYDYGTCDDVTAKAKKQINEAASKARVLVGFLAKQRDQLPGWRKIADGLRGVAGTKLAVETQEPTPEEKKQIEQLADQHWQARDKFVKEYKEGFRVDEKGQKYPNVIGNTQFVEAEFKKKKYLETWDELLGIVQQVPALAYLQPTDVYKEESYINEFGVPSNVNVREKGKFGPGGANDAEIAAAAEKVLKNGIDTRNEVLKIMAEGAKTEMSAGRGGKVKLTEQQRLGKMFELMKYGPVARELLKEDPSMCQTATGIANHISNTELRNNVALMVGMLGTAGAAAVLGPAALAGTAVAAAATPALIGTGVGIGFSAYLGSKDYQRYADSKRRTFSVVETEGVLSKGSEPQRAVADVKEFDQYRNNLALAIALSPLDLVGSGIFMGAAGLTVGKFLEGPGAKLALSQALRAKGLTQVDVDRLLKNLASSDPAVAKAAARKVMTEVGLDENQVRFIRMAAAKRAFTEQNPEAMQAILKEVKDGRVYMGAMKVLEGVNSAKINPANRDQVLRAAIAGADFGVTDPKKLATVITDWDEGLDGLARTYEVAAQKMKNDPAIAKIANLEEKQRASFRAALNDLRAENPELRAMNDAEWKKMADEMEVCPLRAAN
jgi:hypothetical protein